LFKASERAIIQLIENLTYDELFQSGRRKWASSTPANWPVWKYVHINTVFCTRWYGLDKASGVMEAIDDKEFSGSLLTLLQSGEEFVKNNSKKDGRKRLMED